MTAFNVRGLYAITPDTDDTPALLHAVEAVLSGGARVLQYRNKSAAAHVRATQARALHARCRAHGVPLVVNDDVALALAIGAEGVHLGADDGDLRAARLALGPTAILGASCYDDLDRARAAVAAGADYIAFGACFPSGTKPLARRADAALFAAARDLGRPRVAIGGITPDNAATLVAAGADLLAVIGALFDAPDPAAQARRFAALYATPPRDAAPHFLP